MKTLRIILGITFSLSFSLTATAESLWKNGNPSNPVLNESYYTILDDFYVPGAGWWIDRADIYGMFVGGDVPHTGDVNIRILPADPLTGEPDPSQAIDPTVTNVMTDPIDDPVGVRVRANMQKVFLKGQRRYWIEFDVASVKNVSIRGLSSDSPDLLPAYGKFAAGSYQLDALGGDLAFHLYGSEVETVFVPTVDEFKVKLLDNGDQSWTFRLAGKHPIFEPGMYQIQLARQAPALYRIDNDGKHMVDFKVKDDPDSTKFSTPLGDDLCENAPKILQSFCQNFVACAAYEFCGDIPIP